MTICLWSINYCYLNSTKKISRHNHCQKRIFMSELSVPQDVFINLETGPL